MKTLKTLEEIITLQSQEKPIDQQNDFKITFDDRYIDSHTRIISPQIQDNTNKNIPSTEKNLNDNNNNFELKNSPPFSIYSNSTTPSLSELGKQRCAAFHIFY